MERNLVRGSRAAWGEAKEMVTPHLLCQTALAGTSSLQKDLKLGVVAHP